MTNTGTESRQMNLADRIRRLTGGLYFFSVVLFFVYINMSATSVAPRYQDVHARHCLWVFVAFACTISLAAVFQGIGHGLFPPRKGRWITRILFWSLLVVGLLGVNGVDGFRLPFLPISLVVFVLWTWLALLAKIAELVTRRIQARTRHSPRLGE